VSAREYKVKLDGCDADTIITVAIEDQYVPFLGHIADLLNAKSESNCQPCMKVWPVGEPEPERFYADEEDESA
jgi:hypothetical protein